jgi:hypothetical protein
MMTASVTIDGARVLKPNGFELSGPRQRVRLNEGLGHI